MCDFRKYTGQAIDKETGLTVSIPKREGAANRHISEWNLSSSWYQDDTCPVYGEDKAEPGLYIISATGGFYAYHDGENWWHEHQNPYYEFLFEEHDPNQGYLE